jgi:hypothetical protein
VHGNVVGFVALDFVLWIILTGVMRIPFIIDILRMRFDNPAADIAGFRVPGHVISDFEVPCHDGASPVTVSPTTLTGFSQARRFTLIIIEHANSIIG